MNKLGLFGGSFDPIHNGHLHIARAFADELALDSVIFLPAGDPYHKNATSASAAQRLAMVEAAIEGDSRFAASDVDMVRDGATYSVDTVQIFRQHFAGAELWWLMGMDSLLQLHTWKNWRTFARLTHIAVAARAGAARLAGRGVATGQPENLVCAAVRHQFQRDSAAGGGGAKHCGRRTRGGGAVD